MADKKTYLKVPYNGDTIRSIPFNAGHLTALTMAQQLRDGRRKLDVVLRMLNRLVGDETYERITNDFVDGAINESHLTGLLEDIVKATAAYSKAQAQAETGAETPDADRE